MSRYLRKDSKSCYSDRCKSKNTDKKLMAFIAEFDLIYLKNTKVRRERFKDRPDVITKKEIVFAPSPDVVEHKLKKLYDDTGKIDNIKIVKRKSVTDFVRASLPY